MKRKNLNKRIRHNALFLLALGLILLFSANVQAQTAAAKKGSGSSKYTVAMKIDSSYTTMKLAFRKSGSSKVTKVRLDIMRFMGNRWWADADGNEPVRLVYNSNNKLKKIKVSFKQSSKRKFNGTYTVYNVLKAPRISSVKHRFAPPGRDGETYWVTWGKVSGAKGYQCKISSYDEYGWESWYKTTSTSSRKTVTEGSCIIKLKYKVRAYKKVNGIKVYGPWSKTVRSY